MYAFKSVIVTSLTVVLLTGCYSRAGKQTDNATEVYEKITDPSYLFDGVSFEGWEATDYGAQGAVYVQRGELILEMGDGCTGVTWMHDPPVMDYRISLDAKRIAGTDFFCGLTFPFDDEFCSLIIGGWGGALIGLSCIDGLDASENETTGMMNLEDNRWYHITLEVSGGKIKAVIDDQVVVDFTKENHRLSVRPEVYLNIPLGIASWRTTAVLKNIRLEKI
jgi:hypothetical protein